MLKETKLENPEIIIRPISKREIREVNEMLQEGRSSAVIREQLGLSENAVKRIRLAGYYKDPEYEDTKNVSGYMNRDRIKRICDMLIAGDSKRKISDVTGVSPFMVSRIESKDIYADYTKDYDFTKKHTKKYYNKEINEKIGMICQDIKNGIPADKVASKYGLSLYVINGIKSKRYYRDISDNYFKDPL